MQVTADVMVVNRFNHFYQISYHNIYHEHVANVVHLNNSNLMYYYQDFYSVKKFWIVYTNRDLIKFTNRNYHKIYFDFFLDFSKTVLLKY